MKRSRYTEEQIIAILREQEVGAEMADVCRKHGISSARRPELAAVAVSEDVRSGSGPAE